MLYDRALTASEISALTANLQEKYQAQTNSIQEVTYSETAAVGSKTITMTFPSGCGSTYTCTYTKDGGTAVNVTSTTATANFTQPGTLTTSVSDGTSVSTSSYAVSFLEATTGTCASLTYNGSSRTLASGGTGVTYSNNTRTDAGSQNVTVTANAGYLFSDNTSSKTLSCTINKATPTITLSASSGTVGTGKTTTFTATVKSGTATTVSGTLNKTSSATAYATISPNGNTSISSADNSTGKATTITITGVAVGSSTITVAFTPTDTTNFNNATNKTYAVTVQNLCTAPTNSLCKCTGLATCGSDYSSFAYNGSSQQLTTATSGTCYTLSNYNQTNVNTSGYTIQAALKSGYVWSDNTTANKSFKCYLPQATPTITLSATSGTAVNGTTRTFTEKSNVAGTFSNTSSATGTGTVSPASQSASANTNYTVTITGKGGTSASTITTKITPSSTNYKATSKTYSFRSCAQSDKKIWYYGNETGPGPSYFRAMEGIKIGQWGTTQARMMWDCWIEVTAGDFYGTYMTLDDAWGSHYSGCRINSGAFECDTDWLYFSSDWRNFGTTVTDHCWAGYTSGSSGWLESNVYPSYSLNNTC